MCSLDVTPEPKLGPIINNGGKKYRTHCKYKKPGEIRTHNLRNMLINMKHQSSNETYMRSIWVISEIIKQ